ncbi:MAG: hypothetical protein Q8N53_22125 [Longimicrobiales bacterium]|nr:hypothetical protein [Longimicrobiales bacterium]
MTGPLRAARWWLLALWVAAPGCAGTRPVDLATLVQRDSVYLAPGTLEPYSGAVVRHFVDEPDRVQLEGRLEDGTWEGELTVYHRSGRVRYQGSLSKGAACGVWVENRKDEAAENLYRELKREIESMGVYPACPEG